MLPLPDRHNHQLGGNYISSAPPNPSGSSIPSKAILAASSRASPLACNRVRHSCCSRALRCPNFTETHFPKRSFKGQMHLLIPQRGEGTLNHTYNGLTPDKLACHRPLTLNGAYVGSGRRGLRTSRHQWKNSTPFGLAYKRRTVVRSCRARLWTLSRQ